MSDPGDFDDFEDAFIPPPFDDDRPRDWLDDQDDTDFGQWFMDRD